MPRFLTTLFLATAIIYIAVCLGLFVFQRSLIYYPPPRSYTTEIILMTVQNAGERVLVSTRPQEGTQAVIYFGGNAEDVSNNMPELSVAFLNRAIYLMHYRGYGGSSGEPSEEGLLSDAFLLFDRVHALHPNVTIIGRSLGTGIAVHLASLRPIERLILVTPFDSLLSVATQKFPYVPVGWILRDKFESWRYAPQVTAPTLIIAAQNDEVIPPANTQLLRTRFKSGIVSYIVIPNATHNSIQTADYAPR